MSSSILPMGAIWLSAPMITQWTSTVWCRGTRKWASALAPTASLHTWTGPQTASTCRPTTAAAGGFSTGCQVSTRPSTWPAEWILLQDWCQWSVYGPLCCYRAALWDKICLSSVEVGRRWPTGKSWSWCSGRRGRACWAPRLMGYGPSTQISMTSTLWMPTSTIKS